MKVEQSAVNKLRVTEVPNLDPITLYVEDFRLGVGKITIEVFGESWSCGWTAMGERTMLEFIAQCDNCYLISKFAGGMDRFIPSQDETELEKAAREEIIRMRREGDISYGEARDLYDKTVWLGYNDHDTLEDIFGPAWYEFLPQEPNPKYEYLCRILDAVRETARMYVNDEVCNGGG